MPVNFPREKFGAQSLNAETAARLVRLSMKVGIDFGTTRIVVAAVDRGNYPLVNFECRDGQARDWFPPLVAVREDRRAYGWDAWLAQGQPGWTVSRSLKRCLADAGPDTRIEIGGQSFEIRQLMRELMEALREQLREHSTLSIAALALWK